jgi:hypothetical protein
MEQIFSSARRILECPLKSDFIKGKTNFNCYGMMLVTFNHMNCAHLSFNSIYFFGYLHKVILMLLQSFIDFIFTSNYLDTKITSRD